MLILKGPVRLDIEKFTRTLRDAPGMTGAGMVLVHNGFVRANDLSGNRVEGMDVTVDGKKLAGILEDTERLHGVIAVDAWIVEGTLSVGDDIMLLGVAGDTRGNVIYALSTALDSIKAGVTGKKQYPV